MNSRERIESAFSHREPDRTPVFEYVLLSPVADHILGRAYRGDYRRWPEIVAEMGFELAMKAIAEDMVELACLLKHDMIYSIPASEPGSSCDDESEVLQQTDDPAEKVRQRNLKKKANPPEGPVDGDVIYPLLKEEMARRGVDLPILAPAWSHGIWTDTDLMQTMAMEPEVAHEHFALCTRDSMARISVYVQMGIDIIGVGGDFAGNRPLISPKMYHDFIMPEVAKCSRRIHQAGLISINASDGDLWSVIDDFLIGCEVDGYAEIDIQAGMGLGQLKARFGDRITFIGNMDCGNTLSFGTPEQIREETIRCLKAGKGSGGHIFSASNAITESVPFNNYRAMVEAYREYFHLAPLF